MKCDSSNKFDLGYYGQVNSVMIKSSVASNGQINTFRDIIYFADNGKRILCSELITQKK